MSEEPTIFNPWNTKAKLITTEQVEKILELLKKFIWKYIRNGRSKFEFC